MNLDMRSMPERPSPWMGLVNGPEAGAGIVPYIPSAFPPSMEVMRNRRVPVYNWWLTRGAEGHVIGVDFFLVTSFWPHKKKLLGHQAESW